MLDKQEIQALRPDALTPAEIVSKAVQVGIAKASMPVIQVFLLSIMAGLFIGMGGMFMLLMKADASLSFVVSQLLGAFAFVLGLFLVITAGAELFTGNTLLICAKMEKKFSWAALCKNWVIVYLGNLVGALLLVAILFFANYWALNGEAVGNAMMTVATGKIAQPWHVLLLKGIMCNFLVCLAVWIGYASRTIVDKFFAILLPIMAFVACGFEHCVANMFFLPMGLVMKTSGFNYTGTADIAHLDLAGIFYNISAATLGNIIGGAILVGLIYWAIYLRKAK
jgi:formate/nitrite transporter